MRLAEQVVLVTGGGSDLGRAIVDQCSKKGARAAILDRSEERLHRPRRRMLTGWLQRWATFDRLLKIAELWPRALTDLASSITRSAMPGFGISARIIWTSPPISWTKQLTISFK